MPLAEPSAQLGHEIAPLRRPIPPPESLPPSPNEKARATLAANLNRLEARHPGFRFSLVAFDAAPRQLHIRLRVDAPDIWDKVAASKVLMQERLRSTLQERYGGEVEVSVHAGSILITLLLSAIDVASSIHLVVTTVTSLTDYVARVVEQGRFEWPPVATMFGFFELLKRMFLGI